MQRILIEIGTSVGASAVMLAATVVGGRLIADAAAPVEAERPAASVSCVERPLAPIGHGPLQAVSRLCLTGEGVESTVELAGMPSGALFSAWVTYVDHPTSVRTGECASPELTTPGRVASGIANREGRLRLASTVPGLRLSGNSAVEILVVNHGPTSADLAPARARELLAWHSKWSDAAAAPADSDEEPSALLGCSSFWIRGGAEQAEH